MYMYGWVTLTMNTISIPTHSYVCFLLSVATLLGLINSASFMLFRIQPYIVQYDYTPVKP